VRILQRPTFRRSYKKLHKNQLKAVNFAIRAIAKESELGEQKKGDLQQVFVYKFECVNQQLLLAYEVDDDSLILLALGPHENFYRELKNK